MQQPTDQSVGQRKDVARQYLDIALVAGQYKIYYPAMAFDPPTQNVTFNSYTMGTSGLPDIYTQSSRAAGPRAEGVYQVNHECPWHNYYVTLPCTNRA